MNELKQHTTTAGGAFVSAIRTALALASNELLKASNAEQASYRQPIVAQSLKIANAIRKEVNERRAATGEGKVSQNYIIDKMFDDTDEQVELTDKRLDDFAQSTKRFLGMRGFVSLDEAREGLVVCLEQHLANLQTATNGKDELIFTDESFASTFGTALGDSVEVIAD